MNNYFYYRKKRFLLKVLITIGTLSFIVWLVCFFFGLCGLKPGLLVGIPTILLVFLFVCTAAPEGSSPNNKLDWDDDKPTIRTSSKRRKKIILCSEVISGETYLPKKPKKNKKNSANTYSSVFAPAEVRRKTNMLVQVYLHLLQETEKVKALAKESQKNAIRRDYIPLECKLKKGDNVDVLLSIYGETLLTSELKRLVWQGSFTKCSFNFFVPSEINIDELSCVVSLNINGIPIGEMRFITRIVDSPKTINPKITAHKYQKVFVSYSHLDEPKVKFLHEGLEIAKVSHFFDREYLKAGDVFPKVIQDYINSADLFILCWSKNASKSEYVEKERLQALSRAFPQVQPEKDAKLRIYPMSIEPRSELPNDMKNNYHFEII